MKKIISFFLCWFATGIAITSLAGYIVKDMRLASWCPNAVPMAISTAIAILALATAFMLHWSGKRHGNGKCSK